MDPTRASELKTLLDFKFGTGDVLAATKKDGVIHFEEVSWMKRQVRGFLGGEGLKEIKAENVASMIQDFIKENKTTILPNELEALDRQVIDFQSKYLEGKDKNVGTITKQAFTELLIMTKAQESRSPQVVPDAGNGIHPDYKKVSNFRNEPKTATQPKKVIEKTIPEMKEEKLNEQLELSKEIEDLIKKRDRMQRIYSYELKSGNNPHEYDELIQEINNKHLTLKEKIKEYEEQFTENVEGKWITVDIRGIPARCSYYGPMLDGLPHGKGHFFIGGTMYQCEFKNGKLIEESFKEIHKPRK